MLHPAIKFTAEYSKEKVNFLDLNMKLIYGELETDLFVKPTDPHYFLYSTSCHPYHCIIVIPSSQDIKFCRICSDN